MGFHNTDWIRRAITEGVRVHGQIVKLDAEMLLTHGRHLYRIYEEQFAEFLRAIGWKHLPRAGAAPLPTLRSRHRILTLAQ
jgi:hypothetical protein